MKSKMVLFIIFLLLPLASFGGEKEDLAREIIQLSEVGKILDQVISQLDKMQGQMLEGLNIPEDRKQDALNLQNKITSMIISEFNRKEMESDLIKVYSDVYSEEELKGIVDFYKSPAGQSMIKKTPILMDKFSTLNKAKTKDLMPKIVKLINDFKESINLE